MGWEEDKEIITETYFEAINICNVELFGIIKDHSESLKDLLPLIEFILSRLETVSTLTLLNRFWDAEIIFRSALETFTKVLFITSSEKEIQLKKINEYWNSLKEINSIKQSSQAQKNLKFFSDSELHKLAYSPLVLSEAEEKVLREKWPKSKRRKIEQKWSFSEMLIAISKNYRGEEFSAIIPLSHSYRMSSHIMHGDETGVSIIKERELRTEKERKEVEIAHYLRLLNDCFYYVVFLAVEVCHFVEKPKKSIAFFEKRKLLNEIDHLIQNYDNKIYEDEIYDRFR
jgi:hypothetical protein